MAYDVSNPHPEYGKNPNIKNEYGHTEYPKWVDTGKKDAKGQPIRVRCEDEAAEAEAVGHAGKAEAESKPEKAEGWKKK